MLRAAGRVVAARLKAAGMAAGLACGLAVTTVSWGQTPSAAELEALRNLPPEQQRAILEQLGAGQAGTPQRDADLEEQETVEPRAVAPDYADVTRRPDDPFIAGLDTVLLDVQMKAEDTVVGRPLDVEERDRRQAFADRLLKGNPYKLDAAGLLRLPGIRPIPLAGLTAEQATARLGSEPGLANFTIRLNLLPLAKLDAEALQPFGYDLFAGVPSTFAPATDIPVPAEYVVGPGDRLEVQLIGNTKGRYSLVVNRDGRVMFPELGPIAVSGLPFDEARSRIEARVTEQMIGTQAVVTMGDLRSIRVFVLGEAERPGSYTVSGLATITNALFASGGVKKIGSLRDIQLKRSGRLVRRLDLYDLLQNGDTSDDVRLLPGDVIFIPPVGSTVGVTGEIRRPARYELKGESTAAELVRLGGGLTPEADARFARIERIDEGRDRVVLDVDLSGPQGRATRLLTGDLLRIPGTRPTYANAVQLKGHVYRPGPQQYRAGLRLTDVLPSVEDLRPNADPHYVLIRREQAGTRRIQAISADLEQAWRVPMSEANPPLAARDEVIVFDLEMGRGQYLEPILEELRMQAVSTEPTRVVRVSGPVRAEGDYPLEPGMTVGDLIRAGGGLAEQAFGGDAELARYHVIDGQSRRTEVLPIDLARVLGGDASADPPLRPFDTLVIKEIPEWSQQDYVRLEGEVRFPGTYPIARGETLRSVIARAGGLTALAFPRGSLFTREALRERERQQLKVLADRMRQDLASLALQSSQIAGKDAGQASETLAVGEAVLRELQAAEPVGRLVIDLDAVMAAEPGSTADLILKDGDRLRIPKRSQEVTVIGEVQNSTSHFYDPALSRDDYLSKSGGTTQKADDKRIYVVRANGSVEADGGSEWFRTAESGIEPGDTIVVPLDAERMRPLPMWTAVTTILYNIAVAVAAVNSF